MLVVNGDRRGIPSTERTVLDWLRTFNGKFMIGGVAISGCVIPDLRPGHPRAATGTCLLVLTPHGCSVIEVKALATTVGGVLSCPANGPWSQTGIAGSPVHVRQHDTNPLDELRESISNVENLAKQTDLDVPASGIVLVMPELGRPPVVVTSDLPVDIDVLLGSRTELHNRFDTKTSRNTIWTAEQAHALIGALDFAHAVTIEDLLKQGFPGAPATTRTESVAPAPQPDRQPVPPNVPTAEPVYQGRATTNRNRPRHHSLIALAVLITIFGGLWLLRAPHTTSGPRNNGPGITQTARSAPPATPRTETVTPRPAPARPQPCYPLQPNC